MQKTVRAQIRPVKKKNSHVLSKKLKLAQQKKQGPKSALIFRTNSKI